MNNKTKLALAAALIIGATTAASAEDSSSSFGINIYPQVSQQYQAPVAAAPYATNHVSVRQGRALQSAPVALRQGHRVLEDRDVSLGNGNAGNQDWFSVETHDHASSPYAGGGF